MTAPLEARPAYPTKLRVLGDGYDSAMRTRRGVVMAKMVLADTVDQWIFAHDAENECVHGVLPSDRRIGCECWGVDAKNSDWLPPTPKRRKA